MVDRIVEILDNEIKDLKHSVRDNNLSNSQEKKKLELILNKLETVLVDVEQLININLSELDYLFDINNDDIKKVGFFQFMLANQIKLDNSQVDYLANLFQSFIDKLHIMIDKIVSDMNAGLEENEELKALEGLKEKTQNIEDNVYFDAIDLDLLVKHLSKNMDKGQVMNAIIYVTSKSMLALNNLGSREIVTQNDDDNAVDYVYISNLEEDAVRALFDRYNYEFAVLNEKARKEILKYGNLDNMALLFETLEENNIRINDYVNGSGKLKTLLCYSDKKTLEEIIGYIKHDLEVTGSSLSVNDCFESYFNVPNVFVRKTKFKVKENGVPNGGPYDPRAYVSGAYQNYVNNRKLLESMGIQDINYAMKECGSFFPTSYVSNVKRKQAFDLYQIPTDVYSSKLSCFKATYPMETMDSFIELGYFDYLVNNFSRVGKLPDNATFYKIKRAQQMGISHNELFSRGKCFNGNIVDDKVSAYGIDEKNGPVEVGQYYFEAKRPDLAVYDDFVAENDNAGPLVLVWTNFFIKKLESFVDPSNPYIYDFDGIYISRFKVLRYYETLIKNRQAGTVSSLLYAVCKNSILTKAEFDILEKCINNYFKGKARDNLQK